MTGFGQPSLADDDIMTMVHGDWSMSSEGNDGGTKLVHPVCRGHSMLDPPSERSSLQLECPESKPELMT